MWEEWRAEIDATIRRAELERAERDLEERARRDLSVATRPRTGGQARGGQDHWRIRTGVAKARPIL